MGKLPESRSRKITNLILLAIEKSVDGTIRFSDFMNNPGYYAYGDGWNYQPKKASLSKALQRLREKGAIEYINGDELVLRLTDTGKMRAVHAQMQDAPEKWDGKWRIVIFDIPERRRAARDLLRHHLKSWGFEIWQQSVWATKRNCVDLLRKYLEQVGIADWVLVIESDNIGR